MERVELLTVADHFQLQRIGVVVMPDFAPPAGGWQVRLDTVVIVTPDGRCHEVTARLAVWHFNSPDPAVPAEKRWRLVVSFPTLTKNEVPIGSKVLVSQPLKAAMQRRRPPKPSLSQPSARTAPGQRQGKRVVERAHCAVLDLCAARTAAIVR